MKPTTNVFTALLIVIGISSYAKPKAAKTTYVCKPTVEQSPGDYQQLYSAPKSLTEKTIDLHNNKTELIHNEELSETTRSINHFDLLPDHQIAEGLNYNGLDVYKEKLTDLR